MVEWDIPDPNIAADVETLTETSNNIVYDMSNEDYHAHPYISKSGLDLIDISPAHFKKSERNETAAFQKGTLIHCAILEPDFLESRYFGMAETIDRRTKDGKAKYAEYEAKASGRILVTAEEMKMGMRIRDEVSQHKIAGQLFSGGDSEVSIFSEIDGTGVRCRPDYLNGPIAVDLKSTEDAAGGFIRSVTKYRYYVQDPFYTDVMAKEGIDIEHFLFVAIEKSEPYGICVYELDGDAVNYGRKRYRENLDLYRRCLDSGHWPGYEQTINTLSLPRYLLNDL
ncbi:MAG: PD-(D/E)XK nuclease-like domain-containing protein [Methylobacter sp.]